MSAKILDGVLVLDLTRFFSGPQATLFLAGMGAEVIKIDDPLSGDPTAFAPPYAGPMGVSFARQTEQDMGIAYMKRARGKKSATLNLKSEEGRRLFLRLVERADVVIENFSAGVAARLGIDHDSLAAVNPRIISCSLTGYGLSGPDCELKAYDLMVQAATGLMSITGHPGSAPLKAGSPISDAISGVFAANGIVAALLHRERTGEGQAVDISMADCLFSLIFDEPLDCYERLGLGFQQGSRIMRFSPFNVYPAADGWVTLGAASHEDWLGLLRTMERQDIIEAGGDIMQLSWRLSHNAEVDAIVQAWTQHLPMAEIARRLAAAKVPCSPVRSIDEVLAWEQLRQRNMVTPLFNPLADKHMDVSAPGFPIKFSSTPGGYDKPAPLPGADTDEIMSRLAGLTASELASLKASKVI